MGKENVSCQTTAIFIFKTQSHLILLSEPLYSWLGDGGETDGFYFTKWNYLASIDEVFYLDPRGQYCHFYLCLLLVSSTCSTRQEVSLLGSDRVGTGWRSRNSSRLEIGRWPGETGCVTAYHSLLAPRLRVWVWVWLTSDENTSPQCGYRA